MIQEIKNKINPFVCIQKDENKAYALRFCYQPISRMDAAWWDGAGSGTSGVETVQEHDTMGLKVVKEKHKLSDFKTITSVNEVIDECIIKMLDVSRDSSNDLEYKKDDWVGGSSFSYGGKSVPKLNANVMSNILYNGAMVAMSTRRGFGNFVICPSKFNIGKLLSEMGCFEIIHNANTYIEKRGIIDGRMMVYEYSGDVLDDVVVGYNGSTSKNGNSADGGLVLTVLDNNEPLYKITDVGDTDRYYIRVRYPEELKEILKSS